MARKIASYVIIPAAGMGTRMDAGVNKVHLELAGRSLLQRTLLVFEAMEEISAIQLVVREEELNELKHNLKAWGISKAANPVVGGSSRQASVHQGLKALSAFVVDEEAVVLVHDAARCLVTPEIVRRCLEHLLSVGPCVAAVPVKDTIKSVDAELAVTKTLDRSLLWQVQTPQAFSLKALRKAYDEAELCGLEGTDDASLFEARGGLVHVVMGSYENIKITTPEDLALAELYLKRRSGV